MFSDPVGYLLTWTTYGTWLPGDARGWVEYRHGWQPPNPIRELESLALMSEDACRLSIEQREAVERQMADTCVRRGWRLHAANCRSNHVHVVVWGREVSPRKIRADLKSWATRCLHEQFDPQREKWWADRGSTRFLFDDHGLEQAILYVRDAQDRAGLK